MCKYRDLNLWLPQKFTSAAWEQELQAAAGHGIRLRLLHELQKRLLLHT